MDRRSDIEGLRALAVLLVVFSHLKIPGLQAGFIGVDIFFTISGFLITSIMLREYERNYSRNNGYGFISIRAFYFRRAKRILPLSLFISLVVLVYSFFSFNQIKFTRILGDIKWSALFMANFHFVQRGTNYFEHGFAVSPMQHFWSLAVEEQFYVLFPFLFILVTKFHGFRFMGRSFNWLDRIFSLSLVITIVSLIYSIVETFANPIPAYFASSTRAWQISLGSCLAVYQFKSRSKFIIQESKGKDNKRTLLSVTFLILTMTLISQDSKYPGFFAMMPAIFASLVLVSNQNNNKLNQILSYKLMRYLGSRSYSIYLVHWPLFTFYNVSDKNYLLRMITFIFTLFLSEFTFRFIEQPIRRINTPDSLYTKKPLRVFIYDFFRIIRTILFKTRWILLFTSFSIFLLQVSSPDHRVVEQDVQISTIVEKDSSALSESTRDLSPNNSALQYSSQLNLWKIKIKDALPLKKIPSTMNPPFQSLLEERGKQWSLCMSNTIENHCEFGNSSSSKLVVVIGDSFALAFYPTIVKALENSNFLIVGLNREECMVANIVPWIDGKPDQECFDYRQQVFNFISEKHPNLVILSDNASHDISFNGSLLRSGRDDYWSKKLDESLNLISQKTKSFIYLGQPPSQQALTDCVDSHLNIGPNCIGHPSGNLKIRNVQKYLTKKYGGDFINTDDWLCSNGACPPVIDNTPVFWDGSHLGNTFAEKLAPLLKAQLIELGIL